MAKLITVTKEGLKSLQDELSERKGTKRAEIKEAIKIARGFGDLSENSEYDEARDQQAKCESRIAELEYLIKNGVVMSEEEANKNIVSIGSTVTLQYKDGKEVTYYLVGSNEVDPLAKKISDLSPIGMAVIGKTKGDKVTISAPSGDKEATITHFERTKK